MIMRRLALIHHPVHPSATGEPSRATAADTGAAGTGAGTKEGPSGDVQMDHVMDHRPAPLVNHLFGWVLS